MFCVIGRLLPVDIDIVTILAAHVICRDAVAELVALDGPGAREDSAVHLGIVHCYRTVGAPFLLVGRAERTLVMCLDKPFREELNQFISA